MNIQEMFYDQPIYYTLPLSIFRSNDLDKAAQRWKINEQLKGSRQKLKEYLSLVEYCTKQIEKYEKQLYDLDK